MDTTPFTSRTAVVSTLIGMALAGSASMAFAQDRGDLEQLRSTTLALIEALVDSNLISREKADKLIRDAQAKGQAASAAAPVPAEAGADGKKVVRVPYIPDSVKREMRDQVKQDVLAQARVERWGEPGALPDWLGRVEVEGDVRMRYDMTRLDSGNTAPGYSNYYSGSFTRAADIAGPSNGGISSFNTQENTDRMRLRARLGVNARVSDMVSTGITLSTGNTTNRVSTTQTLGQNFNKYSVVLDRGYIKLEPTTWISASAGRIANPFFSTDLVWADDLNFEGVAVTARPHFSQDIQGFFTAGWFPLRESSPGKSDARNLTGVQGGLDWKLGESKNRVKLGLAVYDYNGIEGMGETDAAYSAGSPGYVNRSEYQDGFRQRGNTLFRINAPLDTQNYNWGLASKFTEIDLNASLDLAIYAPVHIILSGNYVKNIAFDRDAIRARTGSPLLDGGDYGYLAKIQIGHPRMEKKGDWNVSAAYRYLGSDAVLDAFTNSDFGLGGTNTKGSILGFNYGIDKRTWISGRWMTSDVIDSMSASPTSATKLAVDSIQIELNVRF